MEKQKWSSVLIALVYIALGVLFIVRPRGVEEALCYVLAAAVAILGLLYLLGYLIAGRSSDGENGSNGFAIGILLIMMALFIVVKEDLIITLVPFLFGVMVLIRGLFIIQTAFMVKRMGFPMGFPLITGLVIMAFGLFIMLYPMEMGQALFILIGCGLLAAGLSGLAEEIFIRSARRRHVNERERLKDMGPSVTTYDEKVEDAIDVEATPVDTAVESAPADTTGAAVEPAPADNAGAATPQDQR